MEKSCHKGAEEHLGEQELGRIFDEVAAEQRSLEEMRAKVGLSHPRSPLEDILGYKEIADRNRHFAMRRVTSPAEIFPVFHELFSSTAAGG